MTRRKRGTGAAAALAAAALLLAGCTAKGTDPGRGTLSVDAAPVSGSMSARTPGLSDVVLNGGGEARHGVTVSVALRLPSGAGKDAGVRLERGPLTAPQDAPAANASPILPVWSPVATVPAAGRPGWVEGRFRVNVPAHGGTVRIRATPGWRLPGPDGQTVPMRVRALQGRSVLSTSTSDLVMEPVEFDAADGPDALPAHGSAEFRFPVVNTARSAVTVQPVLGRSCSRGPHRPCVLRLQEWTGRRWADVPAAPPGADGRTALRPVTVPSRGRTVLRLRAAAPPGPGTADLTLTAPASTGSAAVHVTLPGTPA